MAFPSFEALTVMDNSASPEPGPDGRGEAEGGAGAGTVVSASGGVVPGAGAVAVPVPGDAVPGDSVPGDWVPGDDVPGEAVLVPGVAEGWPVPVPGVQAARPPVAARASSTVISCLRMPGLLKFFPFYRRGPGRSGTGR